MKIGILGGSFNPIHLGHLVLAEQVRDALGFQKVIFIPTRLPPHKPGDVLADAEHRAAMVRSAVYLNPRFEMSDLELKREGPSYTIDTILELRRIRPEDEPTFIIGCDSLSELPTWKDIPLLAKLCRFAVGARPGFSLSALEGVRGRLPEEFIASLKQNFVGIPAIGISSSDIRRRVREGRSIRHMVPEAVHDYIRTHGLYVKIDS